MRCSTMCPAFAFTGRPTASSDLGTRKNLFESGICDETFSHALACMANVFIVTRLDTAGDKGRVVRALNTRALHVNTVLALALPV